MSITAPPRPGQGYFITGGTLPRNAPCYVVRQADTDLYRHLLHGEFCYILTARQMGKSSLMVRTAGRLREEGTAAVVVDLSARGQNLTPDQWYFGQLTSIGRQLDCEDEIEDYWYATAQKNLSPLQRWQGALEHCVLAQCPGRVVIFIDEIDIVRSLGFETDEFFIAIREFYNRRAQDREFERLTFCLIGVATPSSLIADKRVTPFNIGQRIELTDFTPTEADALRDGLASGGRESVVGRLLARIIYWTGGHPFLTQTLCHAIANDSTAMDERAVDRHCQSLYLMPGARERDDNLIFVQDRMLRGDEDTAGVLTTYGRIWAGKKVLEAETPYAPTLRLSGICGRDVAGRLHVRNRIYGRVFDRSWVQTVMPDAEMRRQRAAYRLGVLRTSLIALAVLLVIGAFGVRAMISESRAHRAEAETRAQLFVTTLWLAQRAYDANEVDRAIELLEPYHSQPEYASRWEVRYLWSLCHQEQYVYPAQPGAISEALSPDGRLLRRILSNGTIQEFDASNHQPLRTYKLALPNKSNTAIITASKDGSRFAASVADNKVALLRATDGALLRSVSVGNGNVFSLSLSSDGKTCVIGTGRAGAILVCREADLSTKQLTVPGATENGPFRAATALALSPDAKTLAAGYGDGQLRLWRVDTGALVAELPGHEEAITCLAWSPDGARVVSGGRDGVAHIWSQQAGQSPTRLFHPTETVTSVAFAPDGSTVATGARDRAVRLWDVKTGNLVATFRGHMEFINNLIFSPDGDRLFSNGVDNTVRVWGIRGDGHVGPAQRGGIEGDSAAANADGSRWVFVKRIGKRYQIFTESNQPSKLDPKPLGPLYPTCILDLAVTPDGKQVAVPRSNVIEIWETATGKQLKKYVGDPGHKYDAVTISADGMLLAAAGSRPKDTFGTVDIWDVRSGTLKQSFRYSGDFSPNNIRFADKNQQLILALVRVRFDKQSSIHYDGQVTFLDLRNGAERIMARPESTIGEVEVHEETGLVATTFQMETTGEKSLVLLALHDGSLVREVRLGARGEAVSFSEDGRSVAVGYESGPLALFDVATGRETLVLKDVAVVKEPHFLQDGKSMAALDSQGGLLIWRAD